MNICNNTKAGFIAGHLYMVKDPTDMSKDQVYIYTKLKKMAKLSNGSDVTVVTDIKYWNDVTDQYCLQKV